ncbi:phosphate acetyltransferase, partial [Acetobacter sacchari]
GMTEVVAREQLEDNVVLGTLMLEQGEVDGLVSGAVHTTANTIRPPLQLIKTAPGSSLVSSVFFMLLPDQVLVYGDCAINPDPT